MMRVVTIDGPAGAGKSTVSRLLAGRLGWRLLDTGAMYRAVALAALRGQVALESDEVLGDLAGSLQVVLEADRVWLQGEDVTVAIRTPEVTEATRFSAGSPRVRQLLVGWQRAFAARHDTVAEGRDQGTVVFPDAPAKYFLTASTEERARRRHAEHVARGDDVTFERILADLRERDARDECRAIAPLRPAADALLVDSTDLELEAVAGLIEDDMRRRGVI
jgi:cytidylate kinase